MGQAGQTQYRYIYQCFGDQKTVPWPDAHNIAYGTIFS